MRDPWDTMLKWNFAQASVRYFVFTPEKAAVAQWVNHCNPQVMGSNPIIMQAQNQTEEMLRLVEMVTGGGKSATFSCACSCSL